LANGAVEKSALLPRPLEVASILAVAFIDDSLCRILETEQIQREYRGTKPGAPYLDSEMWAFAKRTALLSRWNTLEITP
jgi:hypothetical protein